MFDYLVVGAGFAGATVAERLASQAGKKVLICVISRVMRHDCGASLGGNVTAKIDVGSPVIFK
jgi:UDP-galactopyranose mutase